MHTIDFIKFGLGLSKGWAEGLLRDMQDAPLTSPTPNGGNHPLWVLGHLTYSESFLFDESIQGKPNRCAEWGKLFGAQSTPVPEAGGYPPMPELFAKWKEIRAAAVAHLDSLTMDDLDRRSHAPEEYGPMFATVGACYSAMIGHPQFHAGQVSDARRAAGRPPLFM
ncbi:MAG: DinB family protein [Planctomycetaceae bacterium]